MMSSSDLTDVCVNQRNSAEFKGLKQCQTDRAAPNTQPRASSHDLP